MRFTAATVIVLCAVLVSPALGAPRLVQSAPAADATLVAPKTVRLIFDEKIAPGPVVEMSMGDGMGLSTALSLSEDGRTLTARPTGPFMRGIWTLHWRAVSAADGSKSEGAYSFTVK